MEGNNAVASVLLLYFHLIREGCFSGDETVYIDKANFDGFKFLNVEVENEFRQEISEQFLREGSVIYLLCDLNDMIVEHEENFLKLDLVKRVSKALESNEMAAIPETDILKNLLRVPELQFDYDEYDILLETVYKKYVLETYETLFGKVSPNKTHQHGQSSAIVHGDIF